MERLRSIHNSKGMSRQLAQEFANLLLILEEKERQQPREKRGSLSHDRHKNRPLISDDDNLKGPHMSKAQATHALLAVAMSSTGCRKSDATCRRELAQAGALALQSPPIWADRPTPVVDEMINPACTWHGPLVRERNDRLPSHDKNSITVVCGTDLSESVYLQACKSGCLRAKLQVARADTSEHTSIRAVIDSGAAWTALRATEARSLGITDFRSTGMRFHGVTGAALKVLGSCDLSIRMGSVQFTTVAFVFENLAEPMLLGTNTLITQGLVIDARNMHLYPGEHKQTLPEGAVPLFQGNSSEPINAVASWPHDTHAVSFFRHQQKLWCKDEQTQTAHSLPTCKNVKYTARRRSHPPTTILEGEGGDNDEEASARKPTKTKKTRRSLP